MAAKLTPPVNERDHIQGSSHAPLELVEYGDYQCPHCGAAHPVVKAIVKRFGKNLRFVFRNFPLAEVHQYAEAAAMAAEAAARQGMFWPMHDMIYEQQSRLNVGALLTFAEELDLDMVAFEHDLTNPSVAQKVEADFESGVRSGVNGTPSFFINGLKYNGGYDYDSLAGTLESLISERQHR
ncbi:DsbA family protein [Flavisolibacter nicotianae]|uniref:DsbA family protein n=1 Tax=Flavisolibacter nicotianae TaxID=2364882 RepID=UPI000EB14BC9|nr:thioredoxin domain-containing protein [Flavisolibacter nicotianae]